MTVPSFKEVAKKNPRRRAYTEGNQNLGIILEDRKKNEYRRLSTTKTLRRLSNLRYSEIGGCQRLAGHSGGKKQ